MDDHPNQKLKDLLQAHASKPLTAEEKAKMRMHLTSYVEKHPVQSPAFSFLKLSSFLPFRSALAGLSVVILFSGVSLASAQTALPGDALYELKLFVNEELPKVFMEEEEEDSFAVLQFENRLKEAETLKEKKGNLTEKEGRILGDKMKEALEGLSEEDLKGPALREQLSSVLEAHESVLEDFKAQFDHLKEKSSKETEEESQTPSSEATEELDSEEDETETDSVLIPDLTPDLLPDSSEEEDEDEPLVEIEEPVLTPSPVIEIPLDFTLDL